MSQIKEHVGDLTGQQLNEINTKAFESAAKLPRPEYEAIHALLVAVILARVGWDVADMNKAAEDAVKAFHAGTQAYRAIIQEAEATKVARY